MKNLLIALSTACVLSLSTAAVAGGKEAKVHVIGSDIIQIQKGTNQIQDAIIGLVSDEYDGSATIMVKKSSIVQLQGSSKNKQTAKIGVIGCDCAEDKKHH